MAGGRASERSALLGPARSVDLDDAAFVDDRELPIVAGANSFPLTSPSYAGALEPVKRSFDEEAPRLSAREEQAREPEPQPMLELRRSLHLIYPVVITYTLEYFPGLVVIMLVGHMDSPDTAKFVAAATLSTMVRALAAWLSGRSACDPLMFVPPAAVHQHLGAVGRLRTVICARHAVRAGLRRAEAHEHRRLPAVVCDRRRRLFAAHFPAQLALGHLPRVGRPGPRGLAARG